MPPRPLVLARAGLAAAVCASVAALAAPAASAQSADAGSVSGVAVGLAEPLTPLLGSTGDSASPLTQTVGSANGSVSNPGPTAPLEVLGSCDAAAAARHRPVILLHGTYGDASQLYDTIGADLRAHGVCTVAPTYGAYAFAPHRGGLAPLTSVSAEQVAQTIDRVRAATGAAAVDLVGFSQGAAVGGYVAKVLRPQAVSHVVSFAGFWGGDVSALVPGGLDQGSAGSLLGVANLGGLADLLPESAAHSRWYGPEGTPFARGISYSLIASTHDPLMPPERSFPSTAAIDAGRRAGATVTTTVLQDGCARDHATHDTIKSDPRVADLVRAALDGTGGGTARCADYS